MSYSGPDGRSHCINDKRLLATTNASIYVEVINAIANDDDSADKMAVLSRNEDDAAQFRTFPHPQLDLPKSIEPCR
jgi:hypothetical protein